MFTLFIVEASMHFRVKTRTIIDGHATHSPLTTRVVCRRSSMLIIDRNLTTKRIGYALQFIGCPNTRVANRDLIITLRVDQVGKTITIKVSHTALRRADALSVRSIEERSNRKNPNRNSHTPIGMFCDRNRLGKTDWTGKFQIVIIRKLRSQSAIDSHIKRLIFLKLFSMFSFNLVRQTIPIHVHQLEIGIIHGIRTIHTGTDIGRTTKRNLDISSSIDSVWFTCINSTKVLPREFISKGVS